MTKNTLTQICIYFFFLLSCTERELSLDTTVNPYLSSHLQVDKSQSEISLPYAISGECGTLVYRITFSHSENAISSIETTPYNQNWALLLPAESLSNGEHHFNIHAFDREDELINQIGLKLNIISNTAALLTTDPEVTNSEGELLAWGAYYREAFGKTGSDLKSILNNIIKGHTILFYSQVWYALESIDADPYNDENIIQIYTGESFPSAKRDTGTGDNLVWNREHCWPKSRGFPSDFFPAYTDIHHLRPASRPVNSDRGTKIYDNGGSAHSLAMDVNYDSDSWEAPDDVKGDLARQMFYMVVRYEDSDFDGVDLELTDNQSLIQSQSGGTAYFGRLSTLIEWHLGDPVSDSERLRNNRIYSNWQNNRNPFIDYPEWVMNIW